MIKKSKVKSQKLKVLGDWGWVVAIGIPILVLFFILRLTNLTLLPVFVDEAIYVRWSQVMRAEPTLRFLPLSDGKQPLFMWLMIPFLKIFSDPLLAGRLLSVLAGLGSMVGIFLMSYELFKNKKISLISSLFYTVVPFTVFFDRMALVDSLLLAFAVWVAYFGVLLIRYLRLDLAMITGMILGAALITKSPALFFAFLLPTTVLLYSFPTRRRLGRLKQVLDFAKVIFLWGVVYIFAFGIYNILRLGPNFQMIAIRNKDYVFSFAEALKHPLDPFQFHLKEIVLWFGNLLTWPIFFLGLIGIIAGFKRNIRERLFLVVWAAFPLLIQSEFAKVFTPRYLLFTVWPLIILAALGVFKLVKQKWPVWLIVILFLMSLPLWYDFQLLFTPEKAPLPRRMRYGYLEEWTAGQGIKEIADFVKEKARTSSVLVGTEGFFGTLPDGLQIYLEKIPNITVIGVGYPISGVHESLINSLVDNDVYLVVNQSRLQIPAEAYGLKLIKEFPKAIDPEGKQDKLLFFEVDKDFWQKR